MCWNEQVSLNTFLFSFSALLLIAYNNTYTQYKIKELNNGWMYLFILSFIFMQLTEFFIWRNLNNPYYNKMFSTLAATLLWIQPICSLMLLSNTIIRNTLLQLYLLLVIPYIMFFYSGNKSFSAKSVNGHLRWLYTEDKPIVWIAWFFFFLFHFVYDKEWITLFFMLLLLFLSVMNYFTDKSFYSMWCWFVNIFLFYYLGYLLLYLPFREKGFC